MLPFLTPASDFFRPSELTITSLAIVYRPPCYGPSHFTEPKDVPIHLPMTHCELSKAGTNTQALD